MDGGSLSKSEPLKTSKTFSNCCGSSGGPDRSNKREGATLKILVYGTGPLGSLFAARLQTAGHDVSILARGQRLIDLREHGIVLEDALTGARTTTHVNIVEQLAPDDAYDLVVVLIRKNQVAAILPALAANQHTPDVLFMGNNAAGPAEYISALGRERVLLGFGSAGGMRDGYVMRVIAEARGRKAAVTIGEVDGRITPRLQSIASVFESAGFQAVLSPNIDAWLKSHAAVISPVALALYMAGGDNYRLARTRDAVVLGIRALRESFRVLRALHIPITPSALRTYAWIPEPILVPLVQRLFNTRSAEIAVAGHAGAARDEMQQIATEFRTLTRSTTVATPVLDRLYTYLDPSIPMIAEGSAQILLDWRGVWIGLGAMAGAIAALILFLNRKGEKSMSVITISRELSSEGSYTVEKVAQAVGYHFADKKTLEEVNHASLSTLSPT